MNKKYHTFKSKESQDNVLFSKIKYQFGKEMSNKYGMLTSLMKKNNKYYVSLYLNTDTKSQGTEILPDAFVVALPELLSHEKIVEYIEQKRPELFL